MFLGPETSQETLKKPKSRPRDTQGAPKRHAKIYQEKSQKCLLGKKCLKPAISFLTNSGSRFWCNFLFFLKLMFVLILDHCLEPFRIPFWNPWWMKTAQREKQMTQNNHQRHQKPKKQHSQKTLKKKNN